MSERISCVFYNFLIEDSPEWLDKSKVKKLVAHQELIKFLICIIKNKHIHHFKTYKKK